MTNLLGSLMLALDSTTIFQIIGAIALVVLIIVFFQLRKRQQ